MTSTLMHETTPQGPPAESDARHPAQLTDAERQALLVNEATIEAGLDTVLQVGAALQAIRDGCLYRETHPTFEHYVKARWKFSRQRAYQLIDAADVAKNLSTVVDVRMVNERQTRALAPLSASDQRVVFKLAKATAPNGRITAKHLKSLATVAQEVMCAHAVDDGTGRPLESFVDHVIVPALVERVVVTISDGSGTCSTSTNGASP